VRPAASVPPPVDGWRLVIPIPKGGVSLATRPAPKGGIHSLPLTLSIEIETTAMDDDMEKDSEEKKRDHSRDLIKRLEEKFVG
jgi:hypothetical protein